MKTPREIKREIETLEIDAFMDSNNVPPLDENHIQNIINNPPMLCEGGCSEDTEYCKCIRTVFQHYSHYEHYLAVIKNEMEDTFVELLFKKR